jgi:hypothetical protein
LPVGAEVRAQPGAQVACPPDVEHLVVRVSEEVDTGALRRPERERTLPLHAARPGRGQLAQLGDRAHSSFLRQANQAEQDLGRRLCVWERAVAGARRGDEPVRERGEVRRPPAEQLAREANGVDHRRRDAPAGQPHGLVVEEGHVEARVVRDEDRVAGEGQKAPDGGGDRRSPAQLGVTEARQGRDCRLQPRAGVGKRREPLFELEPAHANRADLARPGDAGAQPRRLEVEHDEGRLFEQQPLSRRGGERDEVARPAQARVGYDRLVKQ